MKFHRKLTKGLFRRQAVADAAQSDSPPGSDSTLTDCGEAQPVAEQTAEVQIDRKEYGLFPLFPKDGMPIHPPEGDYSVDVVAIHGLNGNHLSTWRHKESNCLWLQDLLPGSLPGCRVFTYGYPAKVYSSYSTAQVEECARFLLARLRDMRDKQPHIHRPIVFVCHSLGGIVFKQALVIAHEDDNQYGDILKSIIGVVFLGTPHSGSPWANLGEVMANIINTFTTAATAGLGPKQMKTDLVNRLNHHSEALHNLCVSSRQRLKNLQVVSFYETKRMPYFSSLIVPKESATLAIVDEDLRPMYEDHKSICRFPRETQSYDMVAQALRRIVSSYLDKKTSIQRDSTHSSNAVFSDDDRECMKILNEHDAAKDMENPQSPISGTCQWVQNHDTFSRWIAKAESALLWLTGHPGSGKTMISWSLFKHLQAQSQAGKAIIYFCQNKNKQTDARAIVIGWILQIIDRHGSMIRHVRRVYNRQGSKLGVFYIILDALDECDKASRPVLLRSILEFLTGPDQPRTNSNGVKFLVTSRPFLRESHVDFMNTQPLGISIDENEPGYIEDLHVFIRERVDAISQSRRYSRDVRDFLYQTLTSKADRSFIWIQIVFESIENSVLTSKSALEKIMNSIPKDLAAVYQRYLASIPPEHQEDASLFLRLILASSRPLTVDELNVAFTIRNVCSTNADVVDNLQESIVHTVHGMLGPLIRISEQKRTKHQVVSLVHLSLKEFLVHGNQNDTSDVLRTTVAQDVSLPLARACIRYLLRDDFDTDLFSSTNLFESPTEGSSNDSSDQEDTYLHSDILFGEPQAVYKTVCESMRTKYTFYAYAALHWTEHLSDCQLADSDELINMVKQLLDFSTSHCKNWLRYHYTTVPNYAEDNALDQEPIVLASQFNLIVILEDLLKRCENSQRAKNRSLYWACRHGHEDIVVALLKADADANAREIDRQTPLATAAEYGHLSCVVKLLEDSHIDLNAPGRDNRSALSFACGNGYSAIVDMLLGYECCDADKPDLFGTTALFWAAGGEQDSIMTALVKSNRININHQDKSGRTVVFWAAGDGTADTLERIVSIKGIDLNLKDHQGRSPLSWAAGNGHASCAKVLLRRTAINKDSLGNNQRGPVSWACGGGHYEVLAELVRHGCPGIDSQDADGWTPLVWAIQTDSPETIRILVQSQMVQIEKSGNSGRTALHWAVEYGHRKVVEVLLKAGADPLVESTSGRTPIDFAKSFQRYDIAEDLLKYSVH